MKRCQKNNRLEQHLHICNGIRAGQAVFFSPSEAYGEGWKVLARMERNRLWVGDASIY